jgi:hypothetical protein
MNMTKLGNLIHGVAMIAALDTATVAQAQAFSGAAFEINRDRVRLGTIGSCAKGTTYLIPTLYLHVTARNTQHAGGGLGNAGSKARVFVQGPDKAELQALAAQIHADIVAQMRSAGFTVLTFDDVKADLADKGRMESNPRYGMPTHGQRAFPGIDFVVVTPNDEQALDYGLMGPAANYGKAAQHSGATLLLPEVFLTLPQLGASASSSQGLTWRSSEAKISFDPAMHLAGANVYGSTAKGAWCSILVPEHGTRLPAPVAGEFREIGVVRDDYGDWSTKRGDFTFVVDDAAFRTGTLAVGHTLGRLITDTMSGRK